MRSICCDSLHLHRRLRTDPTRTALLRRKYEAEMVRRFKAIRRAIWEAIVENDVFGLEPLRTFARAPGRRAFAFTRLDRKVAAFMEWLRQVEAQDILGVSLGTPISSAAQKAWQNVYLQSAYQKGLANAGSQLSRQGVEVRDSWLQTAFLRPTHADRAGLIFTRAYIQLEGITDVMDQQISQTLAQAMIEGAGAKAVARAIVDRVDNIGITRARRLARTEVIAAHAEAQLNSYKEAGIEGVKTMAEYLTARDDKVCPKCAPWEGRVITIEQAAGVIPQHPNCRCAWAPVVVDSEGKILQ